MKPIQLQVQIRIAVLALSIACAALLLITLIQFVSAQGSGNLSRITTSSDSDRSSGSPSQSADGTLLAFYSDSDFLGEGIPNDQREIWLYDTNTMTFTRLTHASAVDRQSALPNLSADGTVVAFQSNSDFFGQGIPDDQLEIWLYDTKTMTLTRVTTASPGGRDSRFPSVNSDGTLVAFRGTADLLGEGLPANEEVWLYDRTAITFTRVTTASDINRGSFSPSLSADGTTLAFYSDSQMLGEEIEVNQDEIWLYDIVTGTLTRLTTASSSDRRSLGPSLSADGRLVAFYSDSDFLGQGIPAGQFEVWLYDTSTITYTRVTTASDVDRYSNTVELSMDGAAVAFQSNSDFLGEGIPAGQREIWMYNTASKTLTRITSASDAERDSLGSSLGEDNTLIAFYSDSDFLGQGIPDNQYEVWLFSIEQKNLYLPLIHRE